MDGTVYPHGSRRSPAPPPALRGELVRRRLLDVVGRRFQVPLTVIVAGAGFGKSTLLAQSIRANQADPRGIDAWLSCEPADCDADHLAAAIVATLGQVSDRSEPIERVLDVIDRLAPIDVCLVIDDVHELPQRSTAAELLGELITRLPPHGHLVIAGRSVPPTDLATRRLAGQIVDMGLDDLAFTPTEVDALARSLGRHSPDGDQLGRFAGWPSLVRLAISAPNGAAPQFLWEEIVAGLTGAERQLLLALATLGWGTASDVAWVAGSGDGGSDPLVDVRLESLATTVPLVSGDADGWYRVHHLWEEAVERIFSDADRASTRQRALDLFQRRGETLRTGWSALRWDDAEALAVASRRLVHESAGALPVDTASRWLVGASQAARETPDLRLLQVALLHARNYDDIRLDDDLDRVIDGYASGGDNGGVVVALILAMAIAHMRGDLARLLAVDELAQALPHADDIPVLRFLRGAMRATKASLEGDAEAAVSAIEAISTGDGPAPINELVLRLHANMLCLCGRADEAVEIAAPTLDSPSPYVRTLHAKVRWLAGDPGGFADGQFIDVPLGTNERYHFYHAFYGMAVATSFGRADLVEDLSATVEKAATIDVRDETMLVFCRAVRHVAQHDGSAAARVIADHVDAHPVCDRVADGRLQRLLAVPYVCDERVRERWRNAELGPSLARQRAVADDLIAAREGTLTAGHQFAPATSVLTTLPLAWSAELVARAVAAGCDSAITLAERLSELTGAGLREELRHAAASSDPAVAKGALELLDRLPDAAHPPIRVGVLGPLTVDAGNDVAAPAAPELRRERVRALLELLVLAGPLRRDRVGELMWPDLDPVAAGRNLRVTLSRLRAVLEPNRPAGRAPRALRIDNEVISIAPPPHVEVDLWEFRDDVAGADEAERRGDRIAAVAHLEAACNRWRGEPFLDVDHDAMAGAVEEVRVMMTDTTLRLGELLHIAGRFDEAATWADRLISTSSYDERPYRLAIAAHIQRRDRHAVSRAVAATQAMLDDLGVEPEPETQMLLRQAADHIGRAPAIAV